MNDIIESIVNSLPGNAELPYTDKAIPVYSRQRRQFVPTNLLAYKTNKLSSDVSLSTGTTYSNGPQISLGSGTWYLTVHATLSRSGSGTRTYTVRLYDGTTTLCSGETTSIASTHSAQISLTVVVMLITPKTIVLQAVADASGTTLKAATPTNSETGATVISAVRIA